MLSAHQPYERFPELIREAAREAGAMAQVAGGVPAMCDGVTQGQAGMELSLFCRDVIAMGTAVALSHDMFDARPDARHLRQDRARPAHRRAALRPPADGLRAGRADALGPAQQREGPHPRSSTPRARSAATELLEAESASYHAPGTCTFYGTANCNQMLMEVMGLHLPGAAFVNPNTPLARRADPRGHPARRRDHRPWATPSRPIGRVLDERAIVNAMVGLLATGGSTNHTLHLVAMARAGRHPDRLGRLRRASRR